ncbi:MAG: DUF1080 domain-containing protein [Planctomycetota bacterium]
MPRQLPPTATATLFVFALCLLHAVTAGAQPQQTPLFDGETLSGFSSTRGGSLDAWGVIDGEIRIIDAGRGGWLRTNRMYRDFELTFEFRIPEGGNSGVGLRCASVGDPAFTGFEIQIADSPPGGTDLHHCGAVYNAIPPIGQAFTGPDTWNTYRIRLVGDSLDVWLNGTRIHNNAALDDRGFFRAPDQRLLLKDRQTTGYIAFQDHGEGGLRLRNISVTDLSPDPDPGDFEFAFDGRTTNGWTQRGGGVFRFEDDGDFVALDGPGHLYSDRVHTDIELHAIVRVATPEETGAPRTGNGGIYFRTFPNEANPDTWPTDHGYEAQIDNHDTRSTHYTGCVYDKAPAATGKPITRDGAWFDYRIRAVGDRIQTFVNGQPMADAQLTEVDRGMIAFQTHHPGNRIEFRDIRWRVPTADKEPR